PPRSPDRTSARRTPRANPRFFFSSRRRHTRSLRDWSSDVCSSDLQGIYTHLAGEYFKVKTATDILFVPYKGAAPAITDVLGGHKIGRASCRERVWIAVGKMTVHKKKEQVSVRRLATEVPAELDTGI